MLWGLMWLLPKSEYQEVVQWQEGLYLWLRKERLRFGIEEKWDNQSMPEDEEEKPRIPFTD